MWKVWSLGNFDALLDVKRFRFLKCFKRSADPELVTLAKDVSSSEEFVFLVPVARFVQHFLQMFVLD